MKLFISDKETINRLLDRPTESPFLVLMSYAHCKGRYESEVIYNNPTKEILVNCRTEIIGVLLKEVGYNVELTLEVEKQWCCLSPEKYLLYLNELKGIYHAKENY